MTVDNCKAGIDIIGEWDKDTFLFAECKWMNKKIDPSVLNTFIERSNLFSYKKKHFSLFPKAVFTKGCIDKANVMGKI